MTLITSCTHSLSEDRRPPPPTSETQHGVPSSSEPSRDVDVNKRGRHPSQDRVDRQAMMRDNPRIYSYQAQTPGSGPPSSEPSRSVDVGKRDRHRSQDGADSQAMAIDNPRIYPHQGQISPHIVPPIPDANKRDGRRRSPEDGGRRESKEGADSQAMPIDNPGTYSYQGQLSPSIGSYPPPCELSRRSIYMPVTSFAVLNVTPNPGYNPVGGNQTTPSTSAPVRASAGGGYGGFNPTPSYHTGSQTHNMAQGQQLHLGAQVVVPQSTGAYNPHEYQFPPENPQSQGGRIVSQPPVSQPPVPQPPVPQPPAPQPPAPQPSVSQPPAPQPPTSGRPPQGT